MVADVRASAWEARDASQWEDGVVRVMPLVSAGLLLIVRL